jgi:aryl-alcohol dehydrogenase-like predicted oxidoreductase
LQLYFDYPPSVAQFALRWILMFDSVTCAIPGAKHPAQAAENARASALPELSEGTMERIRAIYDDLIRDYVHQRW